MINLVVQSAQNVKLVKQRLESHGRLDKRVKIGRQGGGFVVPSVCRDAGEVQELFSGEQAGWFRVEVVEDEERAPRGASGARDPVEALFREVARDEFLLAHLPKRYTIYKPLVLISSSSLELPQWQEVLQQDPSVLRRLVGLFPGCTHVAVNKPIVESDVMRRPFNITPIYGDFGPAPSEQLYAAPTQADFARAFWCSAVQNGIHQTWAPCYTMFSRGNIKEKARVLALEDVRGQDVVDMYAGIGYFTLSYLRAGARHVLCFEINPWSVEGLVRGAAANGFRCQVVQQGQAFVYDPAVRVYVFHESNEHALARLRSLLDRKVPLSVAHINLGLLPTSEASWGPALQLSTASLAHAADRHHVRLHIHENVPAPALPHFLAATAHRLLELAPGAAIEPHSLHRIKTFAPGVWHVVGDFTVLRTPPAAGST